MIFDGAAMDAGPGGDDGGPGSDAVVPPDVVVLDGGMVTCVEAVGPAVCVGTAVCGNGSVFNCAPRSKISPGPGWIFVVGERGAACSNTFESSSSDTSRPAFALSPRSTISRRASLPRAVVFISSCVSHVSSGNSLVTSSTTCSAAGNAYLRCSAKL